MHDFQLNIHKYLEDQIGDLKGYLVSSCLVGLVSIQLNNSTNDNHFVRIYLFDLQTIQMHYMVYLGHLVEV